MTWGIEPATVQLIAQCLSNIANPTNDAHQHVQQGRRYNSKYWRDSPKLTSNRKSADWERIQDRALKKPSGHVRYQVQRIREELTPCVFSCYSLNILCFLQCALWYDEVTSTNEIHTFFFKSSRWKSVFEITLPTARLLTVMHEKHALKKTCMYKLSSWWWTGKVRNMYVKKAQKIESRALIWRMATSLLYVT